MRKFFFFLFILNFVSLFAQKATIKGILKDSKTNETLIGVNISVDSITGTTTNEDGEAKIIAQLIESQGYGGAKMQNPTTQESRVKPLPPKTATTNDSRGPQMKTEATN